MKNARRNEKKEGKKFNHLAESDSKAFMASERQT